MDLLIKRKSENGSKGKKALTEKQELRESANPEGLRLSLVN